ncbi:hypothetical protein BX666DRAFT_2119314 [Dichotomocladium elegans]|nr:hypothetical protein BX666DRAFT_2119314 [Dichotomocladium elegans]
MTVLTSKFRLCLAPPKNTYSTIKPVSVIESSVFDQLVSIVLPDSEINDILNLHESLPLYKVIVSHDIIVQRMTTWLETAHMTVFALQLALKEDNDLSVPVETRSLIDFSFGRIEPFVMIFDEVSDIVLDKLEDDVEEDQTAHREKKVAIKMASAKIRSEWSNLQSFVSTVTCQLDANYARKEMSDLMENALLQIDDLLTSVFQIHEKRFLESSDLTSCGSSVSIDTAFNADNDPTLVDIDRRIEPLFTDVQRIYTLMVPTSSYRPPPPSDPSGALSRMHLRVQQRWEMLRMEVDMLKQELKEERWLVVFQQVSDQIDVMIDGLLTAITQCNDSIQQARTWYQALTTNQSGQGFPIVDRDRFKLSEKNFEAKRKCYTPAINKMLTMLGESIVSRMTGDSAVCRRHKDMVQHWESLKNTMNMMTVKSLPEARRILSLDRRQSSSSADTQSNDPILIDKNDSISRRSSTSVSSSNNSNYCRSQSSVSSMSEGRSHSRLRPSASESSLLNSTAKPPTPRRTKTPGRPRPTHSRDAHAWLLEPPKHIPGRRTQSVDHGLPRTRVDNSKTSSDSCRRSKTPVARPKSSMGHVQQHEDPIRRPTTPSMIPRPKTPTSRLPSMVPRPHSSMMDSPPKSSAFAVPETSTSQSRRLRKKQSMPSLGTARRRASQVPKSLTDSWPQYSDSNNGSDGFRFLSEDPTTMDYVPNPKDPLDVEVARIINASPIRIQCQKGPLGGGRYYFGNDLNLGGRKLYTCKLMSYTDRRTTSKSLENKVLVRVGGGWQDLEIFLLDHSNLMMVTPNTNSRPYSSMGYK